MGGVSHPIALRTFNSLFEMRQGKRTGEGEERGVPFNSLFETLHIGTEPSGRRAGS